MKVLASLQAVESRQAYRENLKIFEMIEQSKRGKPTTLRTWSQWSGDNEK